jgi:hypothetical protein
MVELPITAFAALAQGSSRGGRMFRRESGGRGFKVQHQKGTTVMGDFIGSFWFFVIGIIFLLGLVGVLIVMRNKKDED